MPANASCSAIAREASRARIAYTRCARRSPASAPGRAHKSAISNLPSLSGPCHSARATAAKGALVLSPTFEPTFEHISKRAVFARTHKSPLRYRGTPARVWTPPAPPPPRRSSGSFRYKNARVVGSLFRFAVTLAVSAVSAVSVPPSLPRVRVPFASVSKRTAQSAWYAAPEALDRNARETRAASSRSASPPSFVDCVLIRGAFRAGEAKTSPRAARPWVTRSRSRRARRSVSAISARITPQKCARYASASAKDDADGSSDAADAADAVSTLPELGNARRSAVPPALASAVAAAVSAVSRRVVFGGARHRVGGARAGLRLRVTATSSADDAVPNDAASDARPATPAGPARASAAARSLTPPGGLSAVSRAERWLTTFVSVTFSRENRFVGIASFVSNAAYLLRRAANGTRAVPETAVPGAGPFPEPETPAERLAYRSANAPDPSPAKRASAARASAESPESLSESDSESDSRRFAREPSRGGRASAVGAFAETVARATAPGARNGRSAAADAPGTARPRGANGTRRVFFSSASSFASPFIDGSWLVSWISSSGCTSKPSRPRTGSPSVTASNSASTSLRRATGAPTGLLSSSAAYSLANRSVAPKKLTSRIPSTQRAFLGFLCVSLVYVHAQLRGESILRSGHRGVPRSEEREPPRESCARTTPRDAYRRASPRRSPYSPPIRRASRSTHPGRLGA